MNRKILGLLGALLFAGLGTFLITKAVGGGSGGGGDVAQAPAEEMRSVLVVDQLVPKGTPVSGLAMRSSLQDVPVRLASSEALATLEGIDEKVTIIDLKPGDQVLASRLGEIGQYSRLVAPIDVPEDLLQMAFSLEPQRVLGGQLRAGDQIAVVASFDAGTETEDDGTIIEVPASSHIILHKILVTQVQTSDTVEIVDTDGADDAAVETDPQSLTEAYLANLTVTVALEHEEASKLVFALENGRVWLLSDPEEVPEEEVVEIQTRRTTNR